jgi:chromosomal replication initiator protein
LVHPRQCAFYLARYHTSFSFPQIGRRFGDRDHTTVLHGVRQIEKKMLADWRVAYDIAHLEAML